MSQLVRAAFVSGFAGLFAVAALSPAPVEAAPTDQAEVCLTEAPLQEGEEREVTCTITGTVDIENREICVTGASCEGDGIKVTVELDEPICFGME